ncbi:hypothetical protein SLEP1_g29932 [Rubroshorea leprosula]|uniref:Uncharacterized protein n=1 Tax=Rubroshorea leprosula TaxID=152421 RepID=A0AAV5K0Z4_9ROSI|nr:hypothetical protein SLEP1_g29932 [Rubroshorea leprosula]
MLCRTQSSSCRVGCSFQEPAAASKSRLSTDIQAFLEQPTVTQLPLDDDQYTGDDATMEEDTEERTLEADLDAEFAVLDPELDTQLEEALSRAILKTGRDKDKGDSAPADPSQRKVLSLNHRGTFSHEKFRRTAIVIWKYLYDEPMLFWSSWPEKKKRVAWENFQRTYYWEEDDAHVYKIWRLHCRNHFRDEVHQARKAWVKYKKLLEFMHKDTFKICWQNGGVQNILHSRKETGYPASAPPQTIDPSFGGFRPDYLPPPT